MAVPEPAIRRQATQQRVPDTRCFFYGIRLICPMGATFWLWHTWPPVSADNQTMISCRVLVPLAVSPAIANNKRKQRA